jgi:rfaE bifunctional protein nucleotidyltransferase chain/domain
MPKLEVLQQKIHSLDSIVKKVANWRLKNDSIVFTNGCFDILHRGHVEYLAQASDKGNRLVVGLNTDASVKQQGKGDNRPINDEESRAIVLAGLHHVDAIILFDGDTPYELIKAIQPDALAKGGDYDPEETNPESPKYIVGSDLVKNVFTIDLVPGHSTTGTIKKMQTN